MMMIVEINTSKEVATFLLNKLALVVECVSG